MIVVDNSALVIALVDPSGRGDAVRDRLAGAEIAVPELLDVELASALRGLVLEAKISSVVAEVALREWSVREISRHGHAVLLGRIWALRNNLTAYDATYVALAEFLQANLVTADARLAAAPGIACSVEVVR